MSLSYFYLLPFWVVVTVHCVVVILKEKLFVDALLD